MTTQMKISSKTIFGKDEKNLVTFDGEIKLHKDVLHPLFLLKERLLKKNIDLDVVSSYRSYERQLIIWNEKVEGKREIVDEDGKTILDAKKLSPRELLFKILKWSAIPGFSRHHWGTDFDVFDKNAILNENYKIKLLPAEYLDGPFLKLHNELFFEKTFFRPFMNNKTLVGLEPWHISHRLIARQFEKKISYELFVREIKRSNIALRPLILRYSGKIFREYIIRTM